MIAGVTGPPVAAGTGRPGPTERTVLVRLDQAQLGHGQLPRRAELAAGATRYQFQPNSGHCLVFADPAGHPFCLTTLEDMG